ncbi:glycosyltransferase [Bilophila wadsworthia]|uniref:glycosyltransferase n=1 Tax=Bilophila wadsworthia TaxID=35833 RepID=UPI00321FE1FE
MPRVSVVLTSYNHEKYIGAAIESVLNQTFSDFELIISDDSSTDHSWEIIQNYNDPRIRAVRAPNNARTQSFYDAIHMATGEYLAVHHSDDLWLPEKLEKQVDWLDKHPEQLLVFTRVRPIDEKGNINVTPCIFNQENKTRFDWLRFFFFHGNALCHPSVCMRSEYARDLYRCYGPTLTNDFQFWIKTCLEYDLHVLQEELTVFRINEKSDGGGSAKNAAHLSIELPLVLAHYLKLRTPEEWLNVFPELEDYQRSEGFVPQYGFARLCLQQWQKPSYIYFGLHLLIQLLSDENTRVKLKHLYGFSILQLAHLMKQHDPFDVVNRLIPTGVFIPCINDQPVWDMPYLIDFEVAPDGTYSISLELTKLKTTVPANAVIFCPRQTFFCANKIKQCIIGKEINIATPINADENFSTINQDIFVFNTPQYRIECDSKKDISISISGIIKTLPIETINAIGVYFREFTKKNNQYKKQISILKSEKKHLNFKIIDLEKQLTTFNINKKNYITSRVSALENHSAMLEKIIQEYVAKDSFFKTLPAWKQVCYSIAKNGVRLTARKIMERIYSRCVLRYFLRDQNVAHKVALCVDETNPHRLILISHDMQRGGAPAALLNLARELRNRHHIQLQVLTFQGGPLIDDFNEIGCQVHLLNLPFTGTDTSLPESVKMLLASLAEHGFDKVIGNTVISGRLTKLLKEYGMRVISLVHEMPKLIHMLNLTDNARQLALYSDHIVFGGRHVLENFIYLPDSPKKHITIIGQGSRMPVFTADKTPAREKLRKQLGIPKDAFLVVGCGLGEPRKGTDYFAETLARLTEEENFTPYFLWIGGFCDGILEKKVVDIVNRHGVQHHFIVLDFQKDLIPYFIGADLFFLCSREDPFPTVILDAMRLGLPCLSFSESGGAEEMLGDGRGILVEFLNIDAAAAAIRNFVAMPADKRSALILAAQQYAKEFTPERYAQQLLSLFDITLED